MSSQPPNPPAARWTLPTVLASLLVGAALTTGLLTACLRHGPDDAPAAGAGSSPPSDGRPKLFAGWPVGKSPDIALILTGQQHSYLKFCGCSTPQLGGFERRYNFMASLKARGWPLVAADLGDLVQFTGGIHDQALLKYETEMKAMEILDYKAVGVGADDFALPLIDGMSRFTLQKPTAFPRVLAANLDPAYRAQNFPDPVNAQKSMIGDWLPVKDNRNPNTPLVGIVGLIGRTAQQKIQVTDPNAKFANNAAVLAAALKEMAAAKVEFRVLLFQGSFLDANAIAGQHFKNEFDVILCFSDEDTPPQQEAVVGNTMIIRVGHKGKFIGVVGAFRTANPAKPFDLYYQLVPMGEEYETPKGQEANHPVLTLLDHYAQEVKDQNFLGRVPQRPVPLSPVLTPLGVKPPAYVGTDKCVACHQHQVDRTAAVWQNSKHAHAYTALSKVASKPALRQYDPECISCHVVGYGFQGGFTGHRQTPQMENVGCESCH
ncbi:MAG TPA: multiheme c-type cytochrome, partial [Gemmataceae bacterium]